MSLNLPVNFEADIQGKDTALVPVVVISSPYIGTDWDSLLLSTNITPVRFHRYGTTEGYNEANDIHKTTSPILLNIPSLKESIDIEKRNYKISSVNLVFSNFPYQGERLSDIIGDTSLINAECRIYWTSPSASHLLQYDLGSGVIEYYEDDADAFQVYYGNIRRYTHDDEKVKLVVEDRSQAALHKDLPKKVFDPEDNSVPDKSKNKPIPMVYGPVDRSPLLFANHNRDLIVDSGSIAGFNESEYSDLFLGVNDSGALYMHSGENYINVIRQNQYEYNASLGKISLSGDLISMPSLELGETSSYVEMHCYDYSQNFQISLSNVQEDPDLTTEDFDNPIGSVAALSDGSDSPNYIQWTSPERFMGSFGSLDADPWEVNRLILLHDSSEGNLSMDFRSVVKVHWDSDEEHFEFLLLKLGFNFTPEYDNNGIINLVGMRINGKDISLLLPYNEFGHPAWFAITGHDSVVPSTQLESGYQGGDITDISHQYDNYHSVNDVMRNFHGYSYTDPRHQHYLNFFSIFNFVDFYDCTYNAHTANSNASAAVNFDTTLQWGAEHGQYVSVIGTLKSNPQSSEGGLREISLLREVYVTKIFDQEYYADVNGRGMSWTNVRYVIKDIMNELGHSVEFESSTEYDDWLYAFTVNKKINSKKLIETIASVSPYLPRFDNMGNFKFSEIPYSRGTVLYGNTIKDADVIDFSFSRTPIEDVYTKIVFHYNWDYAMEEFQESTEADTTSLYNATLNTHYKHDYYGFQTIDGNEHAESTIEISDDRGKYIRDPETALKFANWFLRWSCNQHLKMKIKLPLKYMHLEVGDFVDFDDILGGVKPYGINYNTIELLNNQSIFREFLIISTNKTLEWVDIECIQMHNLDPNCTVDCAGICFGDAVDDECGVCGGDNLSCTDCEGVIDGDAVFDCNGVCNGDAMPDSVNGCEIDCEGVVGGFSVIDTCGVCGGEGSIYDCGCEGIPTVTCTYDAYGCYVCPATGISYGGAPECDEFYGDAAMNQLECNIACSEYTACDCDGNVADACGLCEGMEGADGTECLPYANAGADIHVPVSGSVVELDGSASEHTMVGFEIVGYHWEQVEGETVTLYSVPGVGAVYDGLSEKAYFIAPSAGTLKFTLLVWVAFQDELWRAEHGDEPWLGYDEEEYALHPYAIDDKEVSVGTDEPIAVARIDQVSCDADPDDDNCLEEGELNWAYDGGEVSLIGQESYDPNGDPITYSWTLIVHILNNIEVDVSYLLVDPSAMNTSFIAPAVIQEGPFTFELPITMRAKLYVTDDAGGWSIDTVDMVVYDSSDIVDDDDDDDDDTPGSGGGSGMSTWMRWCREHPERCEQFHQEVRSSSSDVCDCKIGDMNCDNNWNILDIVALSNCVMEDNCQDQPYGCAGDLNGDGRWDVLDIVTLANCILAGNCGG